MGWLRKIIKNSHQKKVASTPTVQKRSINVITDYDTIEITGLKSVWINEYLGRWRLMYSDETYEYNCIYWSNSYNKRFEVYKKMLLTAYNNGDAIVELL